MEHFVTPPAGYKPRTVWNEIPDFLGAIGIVLHGLTFVFSLVIGAFAFGGLQLKYAGIVTVISFVFFSLAYWWRFGKSDYHPVWDPTILNYWVCGGLSGFVLSILLAIFARKLGIDPVYAAYLLGGICVVLAFSRAYTVYRRQLWEVNQKETTESK